MSLLRIITAAAFAKLTAPLQAEYKKDSEGDNYTLDLTDYEDPVKLKQAKDHERDQRKLAEKASKDLQTKLDELTEERDGLLSGAIPKGDVQKLEQSYKDKMTKRETELNAQITAAHGTLQKVLVDNVATAMAAEISTSPALIMPHIKARLKTDKADDGTFVTKVVDKEGKPSALTVDDLKKEFVLNPDFKAIITGSKASGGGAGGGGGGGGASGAKVLLTGSPKDIAASFRASGKIKED